MGGMSARAYRLLFWLGLFLLVIVALGLVQAILMPFAALDGVRRGCRA